MLICKMHVISHCIYPTPKQQHHLNLIVIQLSIHRQHHIPGVFRPSQLTVSILCCTRFFQLLRSLDQFAPSQKI